MSGTPFFILTGWLGAGKTTVLNRMLTASGGRKIAVLVNELGRIAIDTKLIVGQGGDILELAGGCICCKVDIKNDLWDGIGDIVARAKPDCVVLETTGIAEPAAILEGMHVRHAADDEGTEIRRVRSRGEAMLDRITPAGVICVVDAESGASALTDRDEAANQAQACDRVLISKLDVASAEAVSRTHAQLDHFAPNAERAAFPVEESRAMTEWMLAPRELRAWKLGHAHPHVHAPHRHGQLIAVSFADDAPMAGDQILAAIERMGDRVVRVKGFVRLADRSRGFIERAGVRTSLVDAGPWPGPERTEIVVIGDDLDEGAVRRALWACRSGA